MTKKIRQKSKKAVFISEVHLVAGAERKTYSDSEVMGFALRTTPKGAFTFYYQHLNKKTGKRDWHFIGEYPEWQIAPARSEAYRLAGLVLDKKDIKAIRRQQVEKDRAGDVTFEQLHDEYIADCQVLVEQPYGTVPRLESWKDTQEILRRPLATWHDWAITSITPADVKTLLRTWSNHGHEPMAQRVRTVLHTMFEWARTEMEYISVNPCAGLPKKKRGNGKKPRVLTAPEIRTFWHGTDQADCPADRLSVLALKLSLVTTLRTGEIASIERTNILAATKTLPARVVIHLAVIKSRKAKNATNTVQPLNSLACEILMEALSIGDPKRKYVFPGTGKRRHTYMHQPTLAHALNRKAKGKKGKNKKGKVSTGRMGILQWLNLAHFTPHTMRRTGATIIRQLGYPESLVGEVLTHKTADKDATPVTRDHYIDIEAMTEVMVVDKRIEALDKLDAALRIILDLADAQVLPTPQKLLAA